MFVCMICVLQTKHVNDDDDDDVVSSERVDYVFAGIILDAASTASISVGERRSAVRHRR